MPGGDRVRGCSHPGSREGACIGFCIGLEWQLQRVLHDEEDIGVLELHPVQPCRWPSPGQPGALGQGLPSTLCGSSSTPPGWTQTPGGFRIEARWGGVSCGGLTCGWPVQSVSDDRPA